MPDPAFNAEIRDKGEIDEALKYHKSSLRLERKIGNLKGAAISLEEIGSIYEEQNNFERAHRHYRQALDIYRQLRLTAEAKIVQEK